MSKAYFFKLPIFIFKIAGLWLKHIGIQNCYGNFTLFSSSLMLHENIHPLGEVIVESCGNDIHGALHMVY
jgi:hypothetical protein